MKITYDDILNNMKIAFYNECGKNPENLGDISTRLSVVASEIYSLYCNMDYSNRQSFVQTAQGQYLDYHAQLRDMSRKSASKAIGELKFIVSTAIDEDILIPKGTICSVKDKPFIQFETDKDAVLRARSYFVKVPATALDVGDGYNIGVNMVTVLVNCPARIESVTNDEPFVGGNNVESDETLRKRLLNSFKVLPNGLNKQSIEDIVCSLDEVLDCNIYGVDTVNRRVNVCAKTIYGSIGYPLIQKIIDKLLALQMLGIEATVVNCSEKTVSLNVIANANAQEVERYCKMYFEQLRIGERIDIISFRVWLSKYIDGIVDIKSDDAVGQYITCNENQILTLGDIEVTPYE